MHNERIQFLWLSLGQGTNIAPRNTRRLNQNVTRFRHRFAGQVINHIRLWFIRREADSLRAAAGNGQQRQNGLMNFGAVIDAASAEHYANFFMVNILLQPTQAH